MTWRNMSPEDLELAFNPRATARNVDERVAAYAAASAATRARLNPVLDVRYPGFANSPCVSAIFLND